MAVLHGDLYKENSVCDYYLLLFCHFCKEGLFSRAFK